MATNDYASTPPNAGNDAPADEEYGAAGGDSVPCVHVYAMADGSFQVEQSVGSPPEGSEAVPDLAGVIAVLESTLGGQQDADPMASAQKGYGKPNEMQAPNPGGLFGE